MYMLRGVWSLCNLTLDGKLYLRVDKNAAFVELHNPLQWQGGSGKRHNVRAQLQEVVSDWLNPISLGTMSASAYIENLA